MKEIISFLKEYGVYVLTAFCFVIEFILLLVKRKPKSVDDFVLALSEAENALPTLISAVEAPGNGAEKKQKVLDACRHLLEKKLSRGLSERELESVNKKLSTSIEVILTTPMKKEIL